MKYLYKEGNRIFTLNLFILLSGFIFGGFASLLLPVEQATEIHQYLSSSFSNILDDTYRGLAIQTSIESMCMDAIKIYIMGLCIVGMIFVVLYLFIKGFSIGFILCFMIIHEGVQNILFIIVGIILPKILYIPVLLTLAYYAIEFSIKILTHNLSATIPEMIRYTGIMVLLLLILFIAGYIDGVLSYIGVKFMLN